MPMEPVIQPMLDVINAAPLPASASLVELNASR